MGRVGSPQQPPLGRSKATALVRGKRMLKAMVIFLLITVLPANADVPRPADARETLLLLAEALHRSAPELDLQINDADLSITMLNGEKEDEVFFPDNLHRSLLAADTDADRQATLDSFVKGLIAVRHQASEDTAMNLSSIFPLVRDVSVFDNIGKDSIPMREIFGNLVVYWVEDSETSTRSITFDRLKQAGISETDMAKIALDNLRARAGTLQFASVGPFKMLILDGYYESSLILLPEIWEKLDTTLGRVTVAVMARDVVIIADADVPGQLGILQGYVDQEFPTLPYSITDVLLVHQKDGWTVLKD
jgi:uncharacterized protein YtpQ (UPF0354 family)